MAESACAKFRFKVEPTVKVGVITLQRKRPWPSCPNPATGNQWSHDMKAQVEEILAKTPFEVVYAPPDIQVVDDPSLRLALRHLQAAQVEVIVAIQPVISDGRLAPVLAQQWGQPLVLWATPEEQTGQMISGNSLVGTHLMSATLRQLGFSIELVFANLDWQLTETQLLKGVHVAFAASYLAKAKVGLVGYHAPGFQDFHPDPFCMRKTFGALMLHLGLQEYEQGGCVPQKAIDDDVHLMKNEKWPLTGQAQYEDLPLSSKHYLAMKALIQEHNLDAIAVRCWPELPNSTAFGAWCYLALARLATEGFPIACEGDVDGALGCLIGKLLGCGVVYLSDWLEHDESTFTLWHGGMAPTQICEPIGSLIGPCISRHFNNQKPGCLDATIKIGIPVTIYRFWVMNEKYHAIILQGNTEKPKRHLLGNNGLVRLPSGLNLTEKFEDWVQHGFPHHVCVVAGHHGKAFQSLARQCNVTVLSAVL